MINTTTYNQYAFCFHRLPCGVCDRTNRMCALQPAQATPSWTVSTGSTTGTVPSYETSSTITATAAEPVDDLQPWRYDYAKNRKTNLKTGETLPIITDLESLNDIPEPSMYDKLDTRNLPLAKSVINPLRKAGYHSIGDLRTATREDILKIPRISKGRLKELEEALYSFGVGLKG